MNELIESRLHLIHPFTHIIAGGTQSGKTFYTQNLIKSMDSLIYPNINNVLICYKEMQPGYQEMKRLDKRVSLLKGMDLSSLPLQQNTLLIIDDQMSESMRDKDIQELFTSGVHHRSVSVLFLTQNLFCQGKFARDIRLNTHYFTIFKTKSFNSQIRYLGRQLFPEHPLFLYEAYKLATPTPYTYLFLDLHPTTHDLLSVQTGVLPNEDRIIFCPK